ncbi:MAG TPA: VacB/RNase II family 3'-5' exoribonuclease [Terriglobales bacterium]|nr:VacB/RNase II family 3'-5' exoribonuclease [Terriglobales bacterium]
MISDSAILRKIEQQPRQNAGFKQLVRELRAHGAERRQLQERLDELVKRGQLRESDGRYQIPRAIASRNQAIGRLTMHRDGYGFVIPDSDELRTRIQGDIYVAPHAIGNAMHGDRVLLELGQQRGEGRVEGRIIRVMDRAHPSVVGIFHYGRKYNYVTPIDEKVTQDIVIPSGQEYPQIEDESEPGARKHRRLDAHRVVGSEARRRTEWDDLEGVAVDVEITEWPTPTQNPKGRVIEILGFEEDFGVDVEIVIRKHHLPHRFPLEVLEEAQEFDDVIPASELRHRRDFRSIPIITIDGETARDFDDAVTVHILPDGNYELQVHIADVAQFVTEGSALDREARLRGTSVYFPDRAIPMLPIELSTDLCSLRPRLDRLVLSCVMQIDRQGEVLGFELNEGVIRSIERMTYTDVNAILDGDSKLRQRYAPLVSNFEMMRDLAMILNRKRMRRGSIDFDLPEPVIEFDENGMMRGISRSERNIAHRLIEEFMLSANECVASYLEKKHVASLYRIHEKPDPKRVFDFETIAAGFGYSLGVGALPIKRMEMKSDRRSHQHAGRNPTRIEIPEDVHITPRMYQKLTDKIAGKPEERILSFLMLRSLKQARYSEENAGHFALAAPTYTHFTSPIRRYPDLIVHRILKEVLRASPEFHDGQVPVGRGTPVGNERPTAWSKRAESYQISERSPWSKESSKRTKNTAEGKAPELFGPIPLPVLHEIAEESSESERRADDAERELMDWKKVKFMAERIGEEFEGLIISVTKFGFFVELKDLFIEGLVPLSTLTDDRYTFHENTRQIIGQRSRKTYSLGETVHVIVDRIDPVLKKINFAVNEPESVKVQGRRRKRS